MQFLRLFVREARHRALGVFAAERGDETIADALRRANDVDRLLVVSSESGVDGGENASLRHDVIRRVHLMVEDSLQLETWAARGHMQRSRRARRFTRVHDCRRP